MKIADYDQLSAQELIALLKAKDQTINLLEQQLRLLSQKRFGRSSEKDPRQQDLVFDEAEAADFPESEQPDDNEVTVASHRRKKTGRAALSSDLPRVEVIHDIADDQKVCPHDGHELHYIGDDICEQLEIIPAKVQVLRHHKRKYACRHCEQTIKTATMPKQPIPKSIATPALLAHVTVAKYQDALPLYRQESILKRSGIELPRATLSNWMLKMGELVTPIINRLRDHLMEGPLIHMDETMVQVLKPDKSNKKPGAKHYMWIQASVIPNKPVRLFDYDSSRGEAVPLRLLEDYQGLLMIDGYQGYNAVAAQSGITQLVCMAHVRRYFHDALKAQDKKSGKAQMAMSFIQKLYTIEKRISPLSAEEKLTIRQQDALPILNKMKSWADKSAGQVIPKSLLGKAIHYFLKQWPTLIRYTEHLHAAIDNNPAENAIRPFTLGRKNWLFAQSTNGVKASANLYSIIETAKANGLEPFDYLKHLFTQLPLAQSIEDIDQLLPWYYQKNDVKV